MKKEELKKRAYQSPEIKVWSIQVDNFLLRVSGNAGSIGWGGSGGDAKRNIGVEEWENESFSLESLTLGPSPKREGSDYPSYNVWED